MSIRRPRRYCLMSLHPWAAEGILSGRKTSELRRIAPRLKAGDVVVIYATSPVQRVCGVVRVQRVEIGEPLDVAERHGEPAMTGVDVAFDYLNGGRRSGAILLTDPQPCEPIRLAARPPQSYRMLDLQHPDDRALIAVPASPNGLRVLHPYARPDRLVFTSSIPTRTADS